ncbi:MAG: PAS domain S-box protein [Ignavibacteriae bacterium]|nr:PAS domain S-box protein [Ignavibacteriota bacterium]
MAHNRSVTAKIKQVILLTSCASLLLCCAGFMTYEYFTSRTRLTNNLTNIANILAMNSTAAITFKNADDAAQVLSALSGQPSIMEAAVYTDSSKLFASYVRLGERPQFPLQPPSGGSVADGSAISVFRPIELNGARIGTLYLRSDLEIINARFRSYAGIAASVMLISLIGGYLVALRLQKNISQPILSLAKTAKHISEGQNYGLRAQHFAQDEFGQLADAFNKMLDEIQRSEETLRAANDSLRASEERFSRFMTNLPGAAWIKDLLGKFIYANDEACRIFNSSPSGVLGKTNSEVFPPNTAEYFDMQDRTAVQHARGIQSIETLFYENDRHHAIFSKFPIFGEEGKPVLIGGIAIDITEQKRAQDDLEESEARFRTVSNAAPVMIWMSGANTVREYFNSPWLEFTGRTLSEENNDKWTTGIHPDDFGATMKTISEAFEKREPFRLEYRLRRADGEYRWVSDHGVPRFTPDGKLLGYIGGCVDTTDRKRAEDLLRQSHEDLEVRVRERTLELARAHAEVRQRDAQLLEAQRKRFADLQQFTGSVQRAQEDERQRIARELHDGVCQNLSGMKLSAEVVEDKVRDVDSNLYRVFRGFVKQCEQMIEEIRRMSANLRPSLLDDFGLVVALQLLAKEFTKQSGVDVALNMDTITRTEINPQSEIALYRIAQECLSNILKYAEPTYVNLTLQKDSTVVTLRVADNGKGFNVAEAALNRSAEHGFGLISMRQRAELSGGTFVVNSTPGEGPVITVEIPLVEEPQYEEESVAR